MKFDGDRVDDSPDTNKIQLLLQWKLLNVITDYNNRIQLRPHVVLTLNAINRLFAILDESPDKNKIQLQLQWKLLNVITDYNNRITSNTGKATYCIDT